MWTHGSSTPRTESGLGVRLRRWWEHLALPAEGERGVGPAPRALSASAATAECDRLPTLPAAEAVSGGATDADAAAEILRSLERSAG